MKEDNDAEYDMVRKPLNETLSPDDLQLGSSSWSGLEDTSAESRLLV